MAKLQVPNDAYYVPTQTDKDLNEVYWTAYVTGQPWAQATAPNPGDFGKYAAVSQDSQVAHGMWQSAYLKLCLPASVNGFPSASADGMNGALKAAMDWLWNHDPESPKNKVY